MTFMEEKDIPFEFTGIQLKAHVEKTLKGIKNKRDALTELDKYIRSPNNRRICCLYGLRRTGKTIMMLQEIQDINDYEHTLLMECAEGYTMAQIRNIIDAYPTIKYLFVDEVTKARNFIDTSSILANRYAAEGIKVVLTGTHSLGFYLARNDELFGRIDFIHTTFVPFKEYNALLNKGIIDYIQYGGTLSPENHFYNKDKTNEYSNSAIVFNIIKSFEKWGNGRNFGVLEDVINNNELPTYINIILEYDNRRFLTRIINDEFNSHDLGSLIDLMTKHDIANTKIMYPSGDNDKQKRKDMTERIRIALHIREKGTLADDDGVNALIDYLKVLDVLYEIPNIKGKQREFIFIQTGMRCSQAKDLAQALVYSEDFDKGYSQVEKKNILDTLNNDILGGILEDIVFYQTRFSLGLDNDNYLVSKFKQSVPSNEFDVCVSNLDEKHSIIIEVKLNGNCVENQTRHLTDRTFCDAFEAYTGTHISNKIVLYLGHNEFDPFENDDEDNKILYINVEDFLVKADTLINELIEKPVKRKEAFCEMFDIPNDKCDVELNHDIKL